MRHPLLPAFLCLALFIIVGESFFGLFSRWYDPMRNQSHYGHYVDSSNWMHVRVREMPQHKNRSIQAVADVMEICDSNGLSHPCHGKILLFFALTDSCPIAYGDELLLLASPDRPSSSDNPHQFDYRSYLFRRGILFTDYVSASSYRIVGNTSGGLMDAVVSLRQHIIDIIRLSSLSPAQQGIAEALFLGWDDDLSPDTEQHFRSSGITHLLCVSGLHVGIIALLTGYCLAFLGNRRRARIAKGTIQILVIWIFVIVTGMAPGTMRAGLMFTLIVAGQMFFSRPPTLNAIAASGFILLVTNPFLLFDIGFQLSYSSVTAIVLFTRPLEDLMPLPDGNSAASRLVLALLRKLRTLLCVSFVAQCAVSPLLLFYFHQFVPYFLVANTVIVPFAALLLGSVMAMVFLAWWPWAFKVVGMLLSAELSVTEWVTSSVASWPNALIEHIYCDKVILVLAYAVIALLGMALLRRRWWCVTAALAVAVAMLLYCRQVESRLGSQSHFDVYRLGNRTAVEFFAGHDSYLLCDSTVASNPESIAFQTSNNLIAHQATRSHILDLDTSFNDGILFVENRFVGFNGKSFRIVDRSNYKEKSGTRPHVDYILLRESPYITVGELMQQYDFDTLVITSQNSQRRRNAWIAQCDSLAIPYLQ